MSTISSVTICNVALSQLGAKVIHSMDDESKNAAWCDMFYDSARRTCLQMHPWNFAIRRLELARDAATPVYGFQYQFTLPADNLRLLGVEDDNSYRVESYKILTNSKTCFISYISDVTDVSSWSQPFVNLMQAAMRKDLSFPITKDSGQEQLSEQLFDKALKLAKQVDTSENTSQRLGSGVPTLIAARG